MRSKAIIHLDMDAFYPSVEVLDNPSLKGGPVIVGGGKERGVVSSASYEARKFGVHSAQPVATAMRLCPEGIFLPVRMWRYKELSRHIFKIFHLFTPLVEPVSIDEAFLCVAGSTRLFGQPEEIAKKIKQVVLERTGLTISAGVAPSKFVAKIASDLNKPDGLTVVPPGRIRAFLDPLSISKLWGVGRETGDALTRLGVRTIGELSRVPVEVLVRKFGKRGTHMHQLSMGVDERAVEPERQVKSIGREETFPRDITKRDKAEQEILYLAHDVARRIRGEGLVGKTITLKVKYSDFVQKTRSTTLDDATDDGRETYRACCMLLDKTEVGKRPIRLLGISVSQLSLPDTEKQVFLFKQGEDFQKKKKLNRALDSIYEAFGEKGVRPGTLFTR